MRSILEAHNIPLPPEQVAVKVAVRNTDPARFETEWKNLLCLSHENVVKVYGGGEYQFRPYYAMELLKDLVAPATIKKEFTLREKLEIIVKELMAGVLYSFQRVPDADEVYRSVFELDPDFNLSAHLERVRELYGLTVFADEMLTHFSEIGPLL